MTLYLRHARSPLSKYSYYKKRYAHEVRRLIEPLVGLTEEELRKKQVAVDAYKFKLQAKTVYARLNWGWKYLIDNFDPEGVYKILRGQCVIQVRGSKVYIRGREENEPISGVVEDYLVDEDGKLSESWQQDLLDFVEEAPEGESLYVNKPINAEKLLWLRDYLTPFVGTSIAIIHMNPNGFHITKNRTLAASQKNLIS